MGPDTTVFPARDSSENEVIMLSSHHEIFVGDIKEVWDQDTVLASEIMQRAGVANTQGFILEALDHPNGQAVQDFNPGDAVNLTLEDRRFYRITPGGGGFS